LQLFFNELLGGKITTFCQSDLIQQTSNCPNVCMFQCLMFQGILMHTDLSHLSKRYQVLLVRAGLRHWRPYARYNHGAPTYSSLPSFLTSSGVRGYYPQKCDCKCLYV